METQTPNFRLRLRGLLEGNQDVISELKKNIQMYNVHKDKVSPAYRSQMERIKRNIDFVVAGSQNAFICSYSFLFVKLILFNHYKRFNIPTKFVLLSFYCFTVEPFALASCKIIELL